MNRFLKSCLAVAAVPALMLTGCAPDPEAGAEDNGGGAENGAPANGAASDQEWDITEVCGDEEIEVALTDGAGGNTWRYIVLAEFEAEAAKCDNITDVHYADGGGDPQKAAADLNGFVAQGVDVIVTLPDFGESMIPSLREAQNAGVTVVPYFTTLSGTEDVDYAVNVPVDQYGMGQQWAEWYGENMQEGNLIMLGGTASCPSCAELFDGLGDGLEDYPDITLLGDSFVTTDYDPETTERAVAGMISQYGEIDGLASEYGLTAEAALGAFEDAGLDLPYTVTASSQNSNYCLWHEFDEADEAFEYASWDEATQVVRSALRHGVAHHNGIEWDEPVSLPFPKVFDTTEGTEPPACEEDLPSDADLHSGLTDEELQDAIG